MKVLSNAGEKAGMKESADKRENLLDQMRTECARGQRSGIHFMLASIPIWLVIGIVQSWEAPVLQRNMLIFCAATPLVPLAYLISGPLGIRFRDDENPLSKLGFLFTCNQILYILIAMWAYGNNPESFLMIYAMIFGAHLMPFSWLYRCRLYLVSAVIVSVGCLFVGGIWGAQAVAAFMLLHQVLFSLGLWRWNVVH